MSRIGKKPIAVPAGVTLTQKGQSISVKGPKGELSFVLPDAVVGEFKDNELTITDVEGVKNASAMWGMARTMVSNMIEGVTKGYSKALELRGVGYRAQAQGTGLTMQLGYSHDINYTPPAGITIEAPKPTSVIVSGINKQQVGQVAAEIRAFRKPEPYKGKGVRYVGEYVRQKEGKKK
ncbi:50S ribosomal protein L6 [Algimonas arctica]|uniref:Large ribosomal subunit protein uL6 n=1 Tax=Algimonas arctica TaxID=1479486 RepID=A0A8J3CSD2_9PROT|nr:50S ribosomal protein L6 [Algimonas arctica]GHA94471.1 50S ribosomal protein L6 [Algimonas arctica]